jgi:hypothetical protein
MRDVIVALCALSMAASAQENPLTWFPLQVGSRWVYEHEWKSGDRNRPAVDRWTTEETVSAWVTIPEGIVVLRDTKDRANQVGSRPRHLVARANYPYLIRGNCVYAISDGWSSKTQDLRPEFRKYLTDGSVSPDFCFPLQAGRKWGNNDIPWRVEPARAGMGLFLPAQYPEAIHIFSDHFGSGGLEDVWFQKGIGVVAEHYIHNGTYDEYTKKLVSFSH